MIRIKEYGAVNPTKQYIVPAFSKQKMLAEIQRNGEAVRNVTSRNEIINTANKFKQSRSNNKNLKSNGKQLGS